MDDLLPVNVIDPDENLQEEELALSLLEEGVDHEVLYQIALGQIFEDHKDGVLVLEDLVETDYVLVVVELLQDPDFVHDFLPAVLVLDIFLLDELDGHLLPAQYLSSEVNLSEAPLPDKLLDLVEVDAGLELDIVLLVFPELSFDVADDTTQRLALDSLLPF